MTNYNDNIITNYFTIPPPERKPCPRGTPKTLVQKRKQQKPQVMTKVTTEYANQRINGIIITKNGIIIEYTNKLKLTSVSSSLFESELLDLCME